MDYNRTLKFLEFLQPKSFRLELGPLTEACHQAFNPQDSYPSLHISGTNGKGSTAAFLSSILKESGYRVGLYTSPHLVDVRERIQIDREMISKEDFAAIATKIKENLPDERSLSYFEFITFISFFYFKDKKVDMAIFETGLGGKLDATNLVTPKVAVITPISFDHTEHLGPTLKEIAKEKAGIIKRGVPTVVAYQTPEVMNVIRRVCDDVGSPLCLATPEEVSMNLGLVGDHQRQNAACAIEAAEILSQSGFKIRNIDSALAKTSWPGRLETVLKTPRVILDGAHNPSGAESLASYVSSSLPRDKAVLMLGVLGDKDVASIIRPLAPLFKEIVCVKAPSHRGASPKDLAAAARSSGAKVLVETGDVSHAIETLVKRMDKEDTLVISGSLTVVGEAKSFFMRRKNV